jgi:acid phosphatase (class A)
MRLVGMRMGALVRLLALALLLGGARQGEARAQTRDEVRFTGWGARELSWLLRPSHFLTREELLALPVAPPPRNSDATTQAELGELLRLQAARTAAQRREIEAHRDFPGLCGAFFAAAQRSATSLPLTMRLLEHVDADLMVAVFNAKRRFDRARPSQLESRLRPSIAVPRHAAYPSGHALQGYVVARVMALLLPRERDTFLSLGQEVGHEREIAGLHFPSDSAASRELGAIIFAKLEANARFQEELAAARREWR